MIEKRADVPFADNQRRRITLLEPRGKNLTKLANVLPEVETFAANLTPEDGAHWLHVIALTASEYYGQNRNGDHWSLEGLTHFPEGWTGEPTVDRELAKSCQYGSGTFYGAYAFPHHCFPAGTQVLMADRTRWQIETVAEGDLVVTSQGTKPVTKVFRRRYDGEGFSFRIQGEPDSLLCTADHPVLVYRRDQVHCRCGYDRRGVPDHGQKCREFREPIGKPSWVSASSVLPGDYVVIPRPPSGEEEVAPEFAELVGWLASEGYSYPDLRRGLLKFTFAEDNEADIETVTACLKANGLAVGVTPVPQHGSIHLSACSIELARRLRDYVVGTKSLKRLTAAVFRWNDEAKLRMLGAYIDGDGHVSRNRKNLGQLRIRSSSPTMRRMLADVIRSLGVPCTIQEDCPPREMVSPTNGKTYMGNGSGTVTVTPYYALLVTKYSRKHAAKEGGSRFRRDPLPEGFLARVLDREEIELHEDVFNLEVDGPHDYVAGEILVHNCNKSPDVAIGRVELVVWNPHQFWVELVIRLDIARTAESKVRWVLDRIKRGAPFDVSMGAKVPFDMATTGDMETYRRAWLNYQPGVHRSPADAVLAEHRRLKSVDGVGIRGLSITRDDYLLECKTDMSRIRPDGIQVGVRNDFPKFFDISIVMVGADKAAKLIKKLATDSSGARRIRQHLDPVGHGIDQAFQLTKAASAKSATVRKEGDIDKETDPAFYEKSVRLLSTNDPDLPQPILHFLKDHPNFDRVLSTLTGLGIILKPKEYEIVASGREAPLVDDRLFTPEIASRMLGVLRRRSVLGPIAEYRLSNVLHGHGEEPPRSSDERYAAYRNRIVGLLDGGPERIFDRNKELWHSVGPSGSTPLVNPLTRRYFSSAFLPEQGA